jgi:tetratricopeptide (TPR) repeat protein
MLKDYQGALQDFNEVLRIEPKNAFALCSRGDTKRMLDDYQGALQDFNEH